jgi:hypothetical protein
MAGGEGSVANPARTIGSLGRFGSYDDMKAIQRIFRSEERKESGFKRRSYTSPHASHRRWAILPVRGLTAGGSGTVSTEATASNRPRSQIMHELDFIPACTEYQ